MLSRPRNPPSKTFLPIKDAGVEELILHLVAVAPLVRFHQVSVGIGSLGILVEILHVRVRRRAVEIEVVLLHVLAVVRLAVREPEDTLLEDGVLPVPQGQGKAEPLLVVGDAGDAVLAPAVSARAGMIVREEVPGVTPLAVVLTDRAPLPFTEVGSPLLPKDLPFPGLCQPFLFCVHVVLLSLHN